MHLGYCIELELHLYSLLDTVAKDGKHVFSHATSDQFLLRAWTWLLKTPREHALADQGRVFFRIVQGIYGIISVELVDDFGTALGDGLEAYSEVNDADGISLIDGDGRYLECVRPSCQAILLVPFEGVMYFHCRNRGERQETHRGRGRVI